MKRHCPIIGKYGVIVYAVINIVLVLLAVNFLGFGFVKDTVLGAALIYCSVFILIFDQSPDQYAFIIFSES